MPSLPLGLSQIIARAMDKDPDMRYQSASADARQVVPGTIPKTTFAAEADEEEGAREDEPRHAR